VAAVVIVVVVGVATTSHLALTTVLLVHLELNIESSRK
jgi:hypothetical protein